jgi:nitrogen fixation protein
MNQRFRAITIRLALSALLFSVMAAKSAGMVLELGSQTQFIHVTPEYSNAVVAALLPHYSDFAKKLNLPISLPIKPEDVAHWGILPEQSKDGGIAGGGIILKNGWSFSFGGGYVNGFESPHSYFGLQDPDKIPKFYGKVQMTTNEAVVLARKTVKQLGIKLGDVFADQEPQVTPPVKIETNVVPRYIIQWTDPCGGHIRMEVNAQTKRVEELLMLSCNLNRSSPKINIIPPKGHGMFDSQLPPSPNPEYAWKLIPIALKAIDEYGEKLFLPIPRPLTTNDVAIVALHNNGGWPHCEITLTNGWRFIYRHTMVNGYYAPDNFFMMGCRPFHIKDFEGKWNLNTNQSIELVKKTLAKLDYPTNNIHMDFAPNIICAAGNFKKTIPRYFFEWHYENAAHDDLQSKVEAEVNANSGKLESLYYDDKAYWGSRPPIGVPISAAK